MNPVDTRADLPTPRDTMGTAYANGNVYIFGGYNWTNSTYYDTVYKYDISSNTLTTLAATIPHADDDMKAFYDSVNDKIYVGPLLHSTASSNEDNRKVVILEFDPNTEQFEPEPALGTTPTGWTSTGTDSVDIPRSIGGNLVFSDHSTTTYLAAQRTIGALSGVRMVEYKVDIANSLSNMQFYISPSPFNFFTNSASLIRNFATTSWQLATASTTNQAIAAIQKNKHIIGHLIDVPNTRNYGLVNRGSRTSAQNWITNNPPLVTLQINTPAGTTANGNGTGAVMIDWMIVRNSTTGTEPTATVNSEEGLYVTTNPSILPNNPVSFTSLSDFTEISVKNGGEIKYQISNDGGVTWYWYNSGWIATSSGYTESNIASEVGSNIASFSTGDGSFVFKAYLNSNGTQLVKLSNIELSYINDITGPARSSTSPSGALSSGTTSTNISLTTDENAICKYSTTPGTSYGFMPQTFGTTGGVNHSQSISSLTNGSSHVYYVRCQDSIGNSNSDDLLISFSVVEITRSESTSSGSRPNNFNLLNKNIPLENENKAIVIFKKEFGFGSRGEEVIELQNFLIKNSYLLKSLNTGFFGNLTKNALTDFQKQNNIFPATGFFGPKTKAIINSKNNSETSSGNYGTNDNFIKPMDTLLRDLKIGMIGEDVRMLQKLLNQNGYFVSNFGAGSNGQETNYFGPKTQKALKDYQSKNNIFPTAGYFGPITRQNMKFKTLKGLWW